MSRFIYILFVNKRRSYTFAALNGYILRYSAFTGVQESRDHLGTFDGVHKGHKAILKKVVDHAGKVNGESVLLTFEPHPRKLLFPGQPLVS